MASAPMAPNNSNDDYSGMDKSDLEDEDKGKLCNGCTYSDATVNVSVAIL
jgi:hypothetical protein